MRLNPSFYDTTHLLHRIHSAFFLQILTHLCNSILQKPQALPQHFRGEILLQAQKPKPLFDKKFRIIVLMISMIPEGLIKLGGSNVLLQIICGIGVSIGFVLPGVSFSYLLVVLGLYESLITYLSNLDFVPLIPLCIGLVIGIVLLAGLLKKAMENWPTITFPVIMGFVLGSLPQVFPGLPQGAAIVWCLLSFVIGGAIIWLTSGELQFVRKSVAK